MMKFAAPADIMANIVAKGFIAIDGTSLTVVDRDATSFSVTLIPLTQTLTILLDKQPGDTVNLETDIIGKYVAARLNPAENGLTAAFLRDNGFPVT